MTGYSMIFIFFVGCTYSKGKVKPGDIQNIEIDVNMAGDSNLWNMIIDDIDFIKLETNDSCVLDEIKKIVLVKDKIIILTWKGGIYIFEKTGKLVKEITNKGKGPFELIRPMDMSISGNGNLMVLAEGKIVEFDSSGNPLSEFFLETQNGVISPINLYWFSPESIYSWCTAIYTSKSENKFHLYKQNNIGTVKAKFFPFQHFSYGVASRFTQIGNNEIVITPPNLNDTISIIKDGLLSPRFCITIKQNRDRTKNPLTGLTNNDFQLPDQLNNYLSRYKIYSLSSNVVLNKTFLTFWLNTPGESYRCFYNTELNMAYVFNCFLKGENESVFYPGSIYCSLDNEFYSSKDAWKVRQLLGNGQTSSSFLPEKRRLKLLEKLKDVKDTDNPILMIIKTKDQ